KTPVALFLCERLLARGRKPGLLSRGYGRTSRFDLRVEATTPVAECGDEPMLLKRRSPGTRVYVGRDRSKLTPSAIAEGCDVLVLDDGLQHHELARDLDIVVIDAANPLGNGHVLPRGPLREDLRAFDRVRSRGLLWFTRADAATAHDPDLELVQQRAHERGLAGPIQSQLAASGESLRGQKVFALAAIARPERFLDTLRGTGAELVGTALFADHQQLTPGQLDDALSSAKRAGAQRVVVTEKDHVRLPPRSADALPIVPLRVDVQVLRGLDALDAALDRVLAGAPVITGRKLDGLP
ncbi:MAG: tetraacyldisaccharide 4'-kinase, partial [Deltaproteobacteria bacterium]|nr:tetraacyldisaccharide 4'-kinase [Deltaproteobacteria bacterium]